MKSQKCTGEVCSVQDTKRLMTCFKDVRGSYFLFRHKGDTQVQLQVEKLCHVHLLPLFVGLFVFQGEPGLHGVKGIRGEPGHKGDRGPLGLPVSTAVHCGISPITKPWSFISSCHPQKSLMFILALSDFLLCISAHISACACVCLCVVVCACVCLYDLLHLLSSFSFAWADYYVTSL